jgi:hypothetical protein
LSTPPPTEAATAAPKSDDYRLISIRHTSAPIGSGGSDWHVYSIAQGPNVITGYRRGTIARVTEDVEQIISGLNERRMVHRGRVNLAPPRRAADRRE